MIFRSVLVVDDDIDVRSVVVRALEMEGYEVQVAGNGLEALAVLNGCTPETLPGSILLDLMMPVMDGESFVNAMCTSEKATYRDLPIIVATAKGSSTGPTIFEHTVATIQKPMDLGELYRTVAKYHRTV